MSITWHAKNRIAKYKLCRDEVIRVATEGERYPAKEGRYACIKGSLVVIVSADDNVITTYIGKPNMIKKLMAA
jgi:hypothetical protein